MSHAPEPPPSASQRPRIGPGLRLRLWLACLSGGLVAAGGTLWLLATPGLSPSDPAMYGWLAGVACASLVVGLSLGLWIDHHVVGHLNGLLLGLRSGRVAELRGLPAGAGWGELSELGDAVQETLERRRQESRALHQIERIREHLKSLKGSIERWQLTERWERPAMPDGDVGEVAEVLSHALQRRAGVDEQNRDAARQVASELAAVIDDAHEAASQAERGFVEATSLQTSVREIHRLSSELTATLARPAPEPAAGAVPAAERARLALEDLVEASSESVASLGRGLLRVQDISDQVQRIANRATLIAIQALSGTGEPAAFAEELKKLALDVREATDRTQRFAREIDAAVSDADARMRGAREHAVARMEVPEPAAPAGGAPADARRLVERVLEMVQDAMRKGERVSTASERASSTAERLARRLENNVSDAEALTIRLAPVGEPVEMAPPAPELRLVDAERAAEEDRAEEPGPGRTEEQP
jgi:methyl-accepting chemotaxis protein